MREVKTIELGGRTFSVTQLGAKDGFATFVKLTKMVGPAIGKLAGGVPAMADAAQLLASNLDEAVAWGVVELFARHTTMTIESGQAIPLTGGIDVFAGKFEDLFAWLEFCLDTNYASFLSGLASRKGLVTQPPTAQSSLKFPVT